MREDITGDPNGPSGNGALTYALDPVGNRLSRVSTLAAFSDQSFDYDANNELTSDGYDLSGNTTASGTDTYVYDFEDRLISKNAGAVTVVYDGDGDRVSKTAAGVTTKYLVDDLNPTGYLQVMDEATGTETQVRYTFGKMLVSQTRNASDMSDTTFYGWDSHRNITFLTDATGAMAATYAYDAWGNLLRTTGSTPNSRLYEGQEVDADLGFINFRARQYKPSTGRFLTIDPLMGRLLKPTSLNRYLSADADPENLWDPTGSQVPLEYEKVATAGLAILAAATAAYATHLFAQRYFEGAPDSPAPSLGSKKPPMNCLLAARLARQQCIQSGRNPVTCAVAYIAAIGLCVKGNFLDIINPHW